MLRPSVLHPISLPEFLRHLIDHHATPTSLVVCSSRADFEQFLLHLVEDARTSERLAPAGTQDAETQDVEHSPSPPPPLLDELLIPTLHNLFTTSAVHLTFCASLETLRAHLSSLTTRAPGDPASQPTPQASTPFGGPTGSYPILALLNPIALHRETTSFSAQGLSRTLAVAIEAAAFRKQKLVIAECPVPHHLRHKGNDAWMDDEETLLGAGFGEREGVEQEEREGGTVTDDLLMAGIAADEDPWAEKLSILNVTTKSFGIGDRAWAGRTVTARSVAERWCRFEKLQ